MKVQHAQAEDDATHINCRVSFFVGFHTLMVGFAGRISKNSGAHTSKRHVPDLEAPVPVLLYTNPC